MGTSKGKAAVTRSDNQNLSTGAVEPGLIIKQAASVVAPQPCVPATSLVRRSHTGHLMSLLSAWPLILALKTPPNPTPQAADAAAMSLLHGNLYSCSPIWDHPPPPPPAIEPSSNGSDAAPGDEDGSLMAQHCCHPDRRLPLPPFVKPPSPWLYCPHFRSSHYCPDSWPPACICAHNTWSTG
jgi:hypothetical protein